MIITRTPYRISMFGGGTDYPDWYMRCGGQVLSTTIDKYVYISCRYLPPFFEHKLRLVYSVVEACNSTDELEHPAAKAILEYFKIKDGLEIHYDGDLPARSGLGSSSSFSVGLIHALSALCDRTIDRRKLAREAIHIEQNIIGENVGSQDQVNAAYGGFNRISFRQNGSIDVEPLPISDQRLKSLNDNLMLFYTGIMRTAELISSSYARNTRENTEQLQKLYGMVDDAATLLLDRSSLDDFGYLLHETWLQKQKLSELVSNDKVNEIYKTAREAGALGGKLCGAGGGGMILLYVPKKYRLDVRNALTSLLYVPFRFSDKGSEVIFSDNQARYKRDDLMSTGVAKPFIELSDLKL